MAHSNAIVNGYCIEFGSKAAAFLNLFLYHLPDLMQMHDKASVAAMNATHALKEAGDREISIKATALTEKAWKSINSYLTQFYI